MPTAYALKPSENNAMILISITYSTDDHESAEHGESIDHGFKSEDEPLTFGELCRLIQRGGFNYPSCSPAKGSTREWLQAEPEQDYTTGEYTTYALHYSHNNPPKNAKYWRAAFKACGIA